MAFCLFFILFVSIANAQDSTQHLTKTYLDKGTWLLGGSLSYLNVKTTNIVNNGFGGTGNTITSTQGIFLGSITGLKMLNSYFAVGGKITYLGNSNSYRKDAVFIGPALRIYISNEGRNILPFMLGELNLSTKEGYSTSYNTGLGLSCFFSKQVSLDITATYGSDFSINKTPQNLNTNLTSFGIFAFQLGLQIYLPREK
ncbi:MAG: hypothetical protein MUF58_02620 [Arcicella sp.]|nr:hypothetical protein [Arcicella sp.]